MLKERRKWSKVAAAFFVLAVALPVISKVMPRPATEAEAVVEQYLLIRAGLMVGMAACIFLGLCVISKKLRCPHCDAMGLSLKKEATVCSNCGFDFEAGTIKETAKVEAVEAIEENTGAEAAEAVEVSDENK